MNFYIILSKRLPLMSDIILINKKIIYNKNTATLFNTETKISTTLVTPANNCLAIILNNGNEITEQKELFSKVWEEYGLPINQNTYYQNISLIRKAFRQMDIDEAIVTIPRRGLTVSSFIQLEPYHENNFPDVSNGQQHPTQHLTVDEGVRTELPGIKIKEHSLFREVFLAPVKVFNFLMPILIFFITLWIINVFFTNKSEMEHYTMNGKINGCNVFYNEKRTTQSWLSISRTIAKFGRSCHRSENVYFTAMQDIPRVSLIYCAGDILNKKTQCASQYIFMNGSL